MIESVQFRNFKALRDTTLPLSRFTLIVGPNGSGKTTALQGIRAVANPGTLAFGNIISAGVGADQYYAEIAVRWGAPYEDVAITVRWRPNGAEGPHETFAGRPRHPDELQPLRSALIRVRSYSLSASVIAQPVHLQPQVELGEDGGSLAGVLDQLRDRDPDRFEALNDEASRWIPEFRHVLFETPATGCRSIVLQTRDGGHRIRAAQVSQGTLLALAMLTLAYLPDPPVVVCLEEPDRGLHPRLLRDVQDALYRLTHPEDHGENREPVQVIATTHSPYMLDLYKDHPEEIVIAHKEGNEARFERLSDRPDIDEILEGAHLGDVWYSGVLGGVPVQP